MLNRLLRLQVGEACAGGLTVSSTRMAGSEFRIAQRQLSSIANALTSSAALIDAADPDTLAHQMQFASIPAPTGAERDRAFAVGRAFSALGYASTMDSAGNVIIGGANYAHRSEIAPIVCMAHLDTVFDAETSLAISRSGSRINCPGIGDNSRGLATMLTLASVIRANQSHFPPLRRPVEFVATVGEEGLGNLRGARAYFANRAEAALMAPHSVLVLDGPGDQNIVHHALGSRRYRVTFRGAGGHSWADFGAPNAVHAAGRAVAWLAELPRSFNGNIALTVSAVSGGESMNAIPAHASIDIDVRATQQQLLERTDSELRAIVRAAVRAETATVNAARRTQTQFANAASAFRHEVVVLGDRPCGVLPAEHEFVQLAEAASRQYGIEPVSAIASTDANIPLSLGIPAITIGGGGSGGGAHTIHEWYDNTQGTRGIMRAFAIFAALAA